MMSSGSDYHLDRCPNRYFISHLHMETLKRLVMVGRSSHRLAWSDADFARAAEEGKSRYELTEELFGIQYQMFRDAVAVVQPSLRITEWQEMALEKAGIPEWGHATWRIALNFFKWEQCPETTGLPNPYDPWIEIMEHGGYFTVEHGQHVDVFGPFERVAYVFVRHA